MKSGFKPQYCLIGLILIVSLALFISCESGSEGGSGDSETPSFSGSLLGTWEGVMYPGHSISFEIEEINGEYYITSAGGDYVAVGCFNDWYIWESNDLQKKIANNECHIYFDEEISVGDDRAMELHIYFDSDLELHGTWIGETFCEPYLIEGGFKAYHCVDKDGDGYDSCNECDDDNANIHWDADEICDGVDNDCDDKIDEGLFYPDKDKDSYGDITDVGQSCPVPESYVSDNTDCNDNDSTINPGADEIPGDGIDQNCDERFTIIGDGTVRDPNTGLIWLKDASCSELAATDESGRANWDVATAAAAALVLVADSGRAFLVGTGTAGGAGLVRGDGKRNGKR